MITSGDKLKHLTLMFIRLCVLWLSSTILSSCTGSTTFNGYIPTPIGSSSVFCAPDYQSACGNVSEQVIGDYGVRRDSVYKKIDGGHYLYFRYRDITPCSSYYPNWRSGSSSRHNRTYSWYSDHLCDPLYIHSVDSDAVQCVGEFENTKTALQWQSVTNSGVLAKFTGRTDDHRLIIECIDSDGSLLGNVKSYECVKPNVPVPLVYGLNVGLKYEDYPLYFVGEDLLTVSTVGLYALTVETLTAGEWMKLWIRHEYDDSVLRDWSGLWFTTPWASDVHYSAIEMKNPGDQASTFIRRMHKNFGSCEEGMAPPDYVDVMLMDVVGRNDDNMRIVMGRVNFTGEEKYQQVSFDTSFDQVPVVFLQVQQVFEWSSDESEIFAYIESEATDSFKFGLFGGVKSDLRCTDTSMSGTGVVQVAYMAVYIPNGMAVVDGVHYELLKGSIKPSEVFEDHKTSFLSAYDSVPTVLASVGASSGPDCVQMFIRGKSTADVTVRLIEDDCTSNNVERSRTEPYRVFAVGKA